MMTSIRYLTKSRFKLAMECPAKLFYTGKDNEYKNTKGDDEFLESLAEGGYLDWFSDEIKADPYIDAFKNAVARYIGN